MRNALGTGVLAVVGAVLAGACGDDPDPTERVFRDDFDSLISGWELSAGAEVDGGSLHLTAGADGSPDATYTFPTPYGPGWELESHFSLTAGVVCLAFEVSTGDERRHTWALDIRIYQGIESTSVEWILQVGDGTGWEFVGASTRLPFQNPMQTKLRVSGDDVTFWWLNLDTEVLSETIFQASQEVVSVKVEASRCRIRAGAMAIDWIQLSELGLQPEAS